jgi:uncharacterized membrane protein SpoIIM required for sporulation
MFSMFGSKLPERRILWLGWILGEAFLFTLAAILIAHSLGAEQAGVFSIFLASASLSGRLSYLLEENQQDYDLGRRGWQANPKTAFGFLALFLGMLLAYMGTALALSELRLSGSFRFAIELAGMNDRSLLSSRFHSTGGVFFYNLRILIAVFILGFLYRSYGMLLSLAWNAGVWGVVFVWLARRGLGSAQESAGLYLLRALVAILPHMLLEALAYVLAGLAALFFSLAFSNHQVGDRHFRRRMRAVRSSLVLSIVMLYVAAWLESHLPRFLLHS